ncbi:MAG: response regulator [Bdellovibrionota bacterium]
MNDKAAGNPGGKDPRRAGIHELNNLLGGILNSAVLLRRARSEEDRAQAIALIEDAARRARDAVVRLREDLGLASSPPPSRAAANSTPRKILLAEDDELSRSALEEFLARSGRYEVRAVADGRSAVDRFLDTPADLLILDAILPGLSGQQVVERIHERHPAARFLVLTGAADSEDPLAHAPGVVGFLQKPIAMDALLAEVDRALR